MKTNNAYYRTALCLLSAFCVVACACTFLAQSENLINYFTFVSIARHTTIERGPSHGTCQILHQTVETDREGRCLFNAESLRNIIRTAYGGDVVEGGPSWIDSYLFDIEANVKDTTTLSGQQLSYMFQRLLAHRFKLKVRRERRKISAFALVLANTGPHFRQVALGERRGMVIGGGRMLGQASMPEIANALALELQTPIVDRTGLSGWFAISMHWAPDESPKDGPKQKTDLPNLISALQSQLGLQLDEIEYFLDDDVIVVETIDLPQDD